MGYRACTRLLVCVVKHSAHGRKAHQSLYFPEPGRSVTTCATARTTLHTRRSLAKTIMTPIRPYRSPFLQTIPYGLSLTQATPDLLLIFTIGGVHNAGRAFLIRSAGASGFLFSKILSSSQASLSYIVACLP